MIVLTHYRAYLQLLLRMTQASIGTEDKRFLKKLGARIRDLRSARGWTLEEVEQYGWKNWQHLQKIESGKNITVVTLKRVAQLYSVSLSKLFEGI